MKTSLYFHIPFCTKKCPYCHFYVIPNQKRHHDILQEALLLEWQSQKHLLQNTDLVSIYFGGGTPSLFGAEALQKILSQISIPPNCEITVEVNPEESDFSLFSSLKSIGVNRISLGVQSLDERSLQALGRLHSAQKAKSAIEEACLAGIENISIDLMYDIPDQTHSSWQETLDQIQYLPITHISLYNLTIEPHTSFYKRKNTLNLPKPEDSLRALDLACKTFEKLHFDRYEISAFARPGYESKHNLGYWTFRPFLGLGPSAFSYWEGKRYQNIPNLLKYHQLLKQGKSPISFEEKLEYPQNFKEQLAVGLRLKKGVLLPPTLPNETLNAIQSLQTMQWIQKEGPQLFLTERGKLFYDSVASEII